MDTKSPYERSQNMARIKSSRTKPEMFIRSALYMRSLRFRVNFTKIPGKPDLFFTKKKVAVFIHGCFWHHHLGCKYASIPKTNPEYWYKKLEKNRLRDESTIENLVGTNFRVLIIWECTIKKMLMDEDYKNRILNEIVKFITAETKDRLCV